MNLEAARRQMVEQQVRAWDVLDTQVLDTLGKVPREAFVPDKYRDLAFADTEIPLGKGEVMMAPKVEGRLLQALNLDGDERVLEIGTGSGFLTACLARMGRHVDSIEFHEDLSAAAGTALRAAGVENVGLRVEDATRFESSRTYDAIAVTASSPRRLRRYESALRTGGRLFIIVGEEPLMEAMLITRIGENAWTTDTLFETVIPPLINVDRPSRFTF